VFPWVLTLDEFLRRTNFCADMREMLGILEEAYGTPVEVEFTVNFLRTGQYRINLLQCRPMEMKGAGVVKAPRLGDISEDALIMRAGGAVVGTSRLIDIDRIIYVVPEEYAQLSERDRHRLADAVGSVVNSDEGRSKRTLLLGPGRWGTSTPSLGVPVSFRDISAVSVLCEIVAMREGLVPDVSLGTHFFNELIEKDILYVALFPKHEGNVLSTDFLLGSSNALAETLPDAEKWSDVIRVIDTSEAARGGKVRLYADTVEQQATCFIEAGGK
jgi:hypothetical protein